jgi:hypothetical protein
MKKIFFALLVLAIGVIPKAKADEGMWLPIFIERLNYENMQEMGLQLTPEEIYSINESSLKDAIIIFGRGCTGEVVSENGLIFTNHHCGYGQIQSHSSVENDILTNGFWAGSLDEELPNPGLTATFLIRIEDVTDKVLAGITDEMSEQQRNSGIRSISRQLTDEATQGTHYEANVRSFYAGDEFYLFVYERFTDVRLVGTPPNAIGKFGGDTDNWMWPRHTGDFAIFRVYTGPDGKPADYAEENTPLKPRHHLPISLDGVKNGDFTMVLGYPGSTDRYRSSWGVELATEESNPTIVDIRGRKLDIMRQYMDASDEVRIQYASKWSGTSNYWKYFIGQTRGLKRLNVIGKKQAEEAAFQQWADADPERRAIFGNVLDMRREATENQREFNLLRIYLGEAIGRGSEIITFSRRFSKLSEMLQNKETEQDDLDTEIERLRTMAENYFKNYHMPLDREMLGAMLELFYNNVPAHQQPPIMAEIGKKHKGDFQLYANRLFDKSVFTSLDDVNRLLDRPRSKTITKDPAFELASAFAETQDMLRTMQSEAREAEAQSNRLFIRGMRQMMEGEKVLYPDANFTMRLTYGQVLDYFPADATHFNYITTLSGVMEKEDPNDREFIVPEKLKTLYNERDFGPYDQNGEMIVCFISNNDITGGNSGSPVLNAKGELIGIAFDGNWEAMSGDIAFEASIQRTISVDIRYVLFIIDKFAGAQHLIDELTIIPKSREHPVNVRQSHTRRLEGVEM